MIQVIELMSDWMNIVLFICLVLWAIARVFEVWLNVVDRLRKERKE